MRVRPEIVAVLDDWRKREQRRQVSEVLLEGLYDPTFNLSKMRGFQSIMMEMLIDNCDADHHLNLYCDTAIASSIDFLLGDSLHQSFFMDSSQRRQL